MKRLILAALILAGMGVAHAGTCDCPYDLDAAGNLCGDRSAWSRPGGRQPDCYSDGAPLLQLPQPERSPLVGLSPQLREAVSGFGRGFQEVSCEALELSIDLPSDVTVLCYSGMVLSVTSDSKWIQLVDMQQEIIRLNPRCPYTTRTKKDWQYSDTNNALTKVIDLYNDDEAYSLILARLGPVFMLFVVSG